MGQHREREISFEVDERWVMPDLDAVVPEGGRAVADQADLHATYSTPTTRCCGGSA